MLSSLRPHVLVAIVLAPAAASAQATIFVPTDQPTIQAAIDAAAPFDEVVVLPGTYFEHDIDFHGKYFTLRSSRGPEETIIDAQGLGRIFVFDQGELPALQVRGFTLQNGAAPSGTPGADGSPNPFAGPSPGENGGPGADGGAILCIGASPTILDCIFRGNRAGDGGPGGDGGSGLPDTGIFGIQAGADGGDGGAGGHGGAVFTDGQSKPLIANCVFVDNHGGAGGDGGSGGMGSKGANQPAVPCLMPGGTGGPGGAGGDGGPGGSGGAVRDVDTSALTLLFACVFVRNAAGDGGAAGAGGPGGEGGDPLVDFMGCPSLPGFPGFSGANGSTGPAGAGGAASNTNSGRLSTCIVWDNGPAPLNNVWSVTWSNVEGGHAGLGNIDADPLFVDEAGGDFRLSPGSPCIDAGENWYVDVSPICTDIDGNQRLADDPLVPDTGSGTGPIVDIGAYERGADAVLLSASPAAISLSAGGTQTYSIDACELHAGELYVMLGTASGTVPGTPFAGVLLPLNIFGDPFFDFVVANAGGPMFPGFLGILDSDGQASAAFVVPPGTAPAAAGLVFDFAYVTFHPLTGKTLAASNPVSMTALP